MLRVSGEMTGQGIELAAVTGGLERDGGVTHGRRLVAFTEAVMRGGEGDVERERRSLAQVLAPEQVVDVAAVIGSFNVVDRIADATGIPLDDMLDAPSADLRRDLGLGRFASAANTPGAAS
jgi:alkylhydroperoxidase family enzyme